MIVTIYGERNGQHTLKLPGALVNRLNWQDKICDVYLSPEHDILIYHAESETLLPGLCLMDQVRLNHILHYEIVMSNDLYALLGLEAGGQLTCGIKHFSDVPVIFLKKL